MTQRDITFASDDKTLRAALSTPSSAGPWPGVVIIHEAFGLTDDIRSIADRFAEQGYLALAPDLYSWGVSARCLVAAFRSMLKRDGPAFDHIESARQWLAADDQCTGNIGIIGFCMGGGFALLCAPRFAFGASSVNYGLVPSDDTEKVLEGACPIVGSFGAKDRGAKGAAARLEAALTALGVDHDVKEYPNAGHSFLNDDKGWHGVLAGMLGGFEPDSANDAWGRIFDFFGTHLAAKG
jgi:carboxymethylenebutenolidase